MTEEQEKQILINRINKANDYLDNIDRAIGNTPKPRGDFSKYSVSELRNNINELNAFIEDMRDKVNSRTSIRVSQTYTPEDKDKRNNTDFSSAPLPWVISKIFKAVFNRS